MATTAQITANQINAQKSTGPRTEAGKARSAQNALRHGLTAKHLVIRPDEQEEFEALRASLLEELDPQGAVETLTFNELLHAAWNLHRFRRIEAKAWKISPDPVSDPILDPVFDRLGRYQARAQRAYYRALRELRTLQTNRALRAQKLDPAVEPEIPTIADINEMTKQTHSEVTAEAIKIATSLLDYETGVLLSSSRNHRPAVPEKLDNPALRL